MHYQMVYLSFFLKKTTDGVLLDCVCVCLKLWHLNSVLRKMHLISVSSEMLRVRLDKHTQTLLFHCFTFC